MYQNTHFEAYVQKVLIDNKEYMFKNDTDILCIVYGLVDPITLNIRYIGKTINGMSRPYEHFKPSSLKEGNTKKNNWLKKLFTQNLLPFIIVINEFDQISNDELYLKEQESIKYYKQFNDLTNLGDGGPGMTGFKFSEESRKKMSESAKKRGLPKALLLQQQPKGLPKKKKKHKSRVIPGARQNYANSMKIAIKGQNINTKEIIEFMGMRDAEKYFNNKFNRTNLKFSIEKQTPYYGYLWSFK